MQAMVARSEWPARMFRMTKETALLDKENMLESAAIDGENVAETAETPQKYD